MEGQWASELGKWKVYLGKKRMDSDCDVCLTLKQEMITRPQQLITKIIQGKKTNHVSLAKFGIYPSQVE